MGIGTEVSLEVGGTLARGGMVAFALMEGIGQGLERVAQDRRDAVSILAAEVHRQRVALAQAQAEAVAARQEAARLRANLAEQVRSTEFQYGARLLAERGLARALGQLYPRRG